MFKRNFKDWALFILVTFIIVGLYGVVESVEAALWVSL